MARKDRKVKDTFPRYMSLPRDVRHRICGFVVLPAAGEMRLDGPPLDRRYTQVSHQFTQEIQLAYQSQFAVADERALDLAAAALRGLQLRDHPRVLLEVRSAFPGDAFAASAEGLTDLVLHRGLRVVDIEIAAATRSEALLGALPGDDALVRHARAGVARRGRADPATGLAAFWSSAAGQKMLDLVTHARLHAVGLRVAARGHWAVFCPYHEPVAGGGGGCRPVPGHWAGDSMVQAVEGGGERTLRVEIERLPWFDAKKQGAAARVKGERILIARKKAQAQAEARARSLQLSSTL